MPRNRITAAELMARLATDPGYQARTAARDAALAQASAKSAADERLLVGEIRRAGYDVDSVWDLVNNTPHPFLPRRFVGPYPRAYPILIRHLGVAHEPAVREGVIRALTVRDGGLEVERALFEQFEVEERQSLRWALANALKVAMPYSRRRRCPAIAAAIRAGSGV